MLGSLVLAIPQLTLSTVERGSGAILREVLAVPEGRKAGVAVCKMDLQKRPLLLRQLPRREEGTKSNKLFV
ncbi:hypothetical protein [Acidicapsa ligni]|uniref:hypothetical protein n=1 Tax=Acidicapsa ligni TaxID=542300 RepID=UPI0021DF58F4|nr:hypothetical protein [Acidicapsa ligni]